MSKDYQTSAFKELLDKLQQESWQLELLISGFAIFGLFSATDNIQVKLDVAENSQRLAETLIWFATKICCWILIANLLIHVVLRGLWIGALGLRYVSGDIDYEHLNYSPKFTNYLKRKIGSFDRYIATLENYCSVLFAVSFLFIFYFLASFMFVIILLLIIFIFLDNDFEGSLEKTLQISGIVLIIFTILGTGLTFIDFITQGFLKRKKWTTKFYFPVYKVMSYLSLSFLYRPLVYNFLDNKFGKRLSFILVPVYLAVFIGSTYYYRESNYFQLNDQSSSYYTNAGNYEDLIIKENDFIRTATIQSKVITEDYIKVFIKHSKNVEERIFLHNKSLKPKEDKRGFSSSIDINNDDIWRNSRERDSLRRSFIKTFNKVYRVYINDSLYATDFMVSSNHQKKLGFETYLNIKNLSKGKHLLKLKRDRIRKKDTVEFTFLVIPFWRQ